MDLSKNEILNLIDEYQKHKVLWDPGHKGYFNKNNKSKAWQSIARASGVEEKDARRKMASLLGSFRREKAKGKKIKSKDALSEYKSDWFAFHKFSFLLETNDQKSLNSEDETEHDDNDNDNEEIEVIIPKTEISAVTYEETHENDGTNIDNILESNSAAFLEPEAPSYKRPRLSSALYENTNLEIRVKKDNELIQLQFAKEQERRDATSRFVGYLEAKLNQYDPTTNAILIHKINQLIFETDMSSILKPNASHSMLSASPRSCLTPSPPHINTNFDKKIVKNSI